MKNYISCIAHPTSEGNLLLGETKTALFDCGMQFCAEETIEKVTAALNGRKLDYLFATHTHYDHIGSLPMLRAAFPTLKLVTTAAGAEVLLKDTPRRVIRELSLEAYERFAPEKTPAEYCDSAFYADIIVKDGDKLDLGGYSVRVIETPGHTRDSLSFFVDEAGLLILSESTGVLLPDGSISPTYLTSCKDALAAAETCAALPYSKISIPHRSIVEDSEIVGLFEKSHTATAQCRDFILGLYQTGMDADAIHAEYIKKYGTEDLLALQPLNALIINARATIAFTLREYT